MDPQFWMERWRSGQTPFHKAAPHRALTGWWGALGVAPPAPVLVPLCGKSPDLGWLGEQGHEVVGVELSPIAVRDFFRERGETPDVRSRGPLRAWSAGRITLLEGDLFALEPGSTGPFGAVYDRGALVALPDAMRARYAEHLAALVPPTAPQLLVTLEYDAREMQGPPFSVPMSEVEALYGDRYRTELLDEREVLELEPHLRERGLSRLVERIIHLVPRAGRVD